MKTWGCSGGIALLFLFNLGARWGGWLMRSLSHFMSWKETQYPLYKRLGRPWGWSGCVGKISVPLQFTTPTVSLCDSCIKNSDILSSQILRLSLQVPIQPCIFYCFYTLLCVCWYMLWVYLAFQNSDSPSIIILLALFYFLLHCR